MASRAAFTPTRLCTRSRSANPAPIASTPEGAWTKSPRASVLLATPGYATARLETTPFPSAPAAQDARHIKAMNPAIQHILVLSYLLCLVDRHPIHDKRHFTAPATIATRPFLNRKEASNSGLACPVLPLARLWALARESWRMPERACPGTRSAILATSSGTASLARGGTPARRRDDARNQMEACFRLSDRRQAAQPWEDVW